MIRKKDIVAMVAVAVMAGGCTSGDEVRQKERVPILLTANVGVEALTRGVDGQVVRTEGAVTRGTQETALASGETVYVWAKEDGGSSWDYLKAWTLTADGSTGLSGSSQYYPLDGNGITMNAVHGNFASSPEEGTTAIASLTHSVAADQSAEGGYEKSDLLFGSATGSDASSAENIAFAHRLAKVEVNLTPGYGYADSDLATAEVRLNNVLPSVAVDPTDGTIGSASGTATTITPRRAGTSYEAVIPPQTFTNPDALISVTTTKDGLTLTSTVPNDVATFEGNTKYVYDVKVRKIPISPSDNQASNPLTYMAEYNYNGSGFYSNNDANSSSYWMCTWPWTFEHKDDVFTINGENYHIPNVAELRSVIPNGINFGNENVISDFTELEAYIHNGSQTIPSTQTVYYGTADGTRKVYYAIRFINTPFCSVWKYDRAATAANSADGGRLTIESFILDSPITTVDEAKEVILSLIANWPTEKTVKRYMPASGYKSSLGGDASPVTSEAGFLSGLSQVGNYGRYWSCTENSEAESNAHRVRFEVDYLNVGSSGKQTGCCLRLFHD